MVHQKSIAGYKFIDQPNLRRLRHRHGILHMRVSLRFSHLVFILDRYGYYIINCLLKDFLILLLPPKIIYFSQEWETQRRPHNPNDDWSWIFVFRNFSTRNIHSGPIMWVRCAHFDRILFWWSIEHETTLIVQLHRIGVNFAIIYHSWWQFLYLGAHRFCFSSSSCSQISHSHSNLYVFDCHDLSN